MRGKKDATTFPDKPVYIYFMLSKYFSLILDPPPLISKLLFKNLKFLLKKHFFSS